jgi:hypothetical protein
MLSFVAFPDTQPGAASRVMRPTPPTPAAIPADAETVQRGQLGDLWPLTVDEGAVQCVDGSYVLFITGGVAYAVNGRARGRLQDSKTSPHPVSPN